MASLSSIQWTDATWNVVRGCTRVSEGCRHCYAERQAARFRGPGKPYEGLVRTHSSGEPRWTGDVRLVAELLDWPLRWRGSKDARAEGRPSRIFVNSMSDLFHEAVPFTFIADVFHTMTGECDGRPAPDHIYQILTKRPRRMLEFFDWLRSSREADEHPAIYALRCLYDNPVPFPRIWLGISVEDQETADERIPNLLRAPSAVRFVSYEPALGPVDFTPHFDRWMDLRGHGTLDLVIVGGESGPGARPCDVAWIRSTVEQCRAAGVACFVKQLGRHVLAAEDAGWEPWSLRFADGRFWADLDDRKGGDPDEWPEDLRVRELPA